MKRGVSTMLSDDEVLDAERVGASVARWQLPVFAGGGQSEPITAQQLEDIEQAAYQDGFQRGQGEGFNAGQQAVLKQSQRLQALVAHLAKPLEQLDAEVEQALAELAMGVARRLIGAELAASPEQVVGMVREALAAVPPYQRNVRVEAHPEDVALLKEQLQPPPDADAFKVVADPSLSAGDCRIVTESSSIDGRIESRMRSVAQTLRGDAE